MEGQHQVYDCLEKLNISYERIEHGPMFHSNDLAEEFEDVEVLDIKNLFFRNQKGRRHYLVVMPYLKQMSVASIARLVGEKRLSFASEERLLRHLGVTTGAVSVFNLLNNVDLDVLVYIDEEIFSSKRVGFHPNINTETLIFDSGDLRRYLDSLRHTIHIIPMR